jgi:peptidoglycan/xylan/chitin deacetylase (PgdA/CDA1 family)
MYHSISDQAAPRFRRFAVTPAAFAQQMAYLNENDYRPMTVTQLSAAIAGRGEALTPRPVVLTFDDGFADFYTEALPVLERSGFAATLYVCTGFVGKTSRWLRREGEADRSMLSWEQLREISAAGIECAAHSHTHRPLDSLPPAVALEEVARPKEILEERLSRKVATFAYPFGLYTEAISNMVREVGYSSACAVRYSMSSTGDDVFALARLMVTRSTSLSDFHRLVEGRTLPGLVFMRTIAKLRRLARNARYWTRQQGSSGSRGLQTPPGRDGIVG